jgi:hypothetical protein
MENNCDRSNTRLKKQSINGLEESQALLPLLMNQIPQGIFGKDRYLVYLGCNQKFASDAGLTPEEIVGKTDYDLPWTKAEADFYRKCDRQIMASNTPELGIKVAQSLEEITQAIRQSLDTQKIFQTTTREIRQLLKADRVAIFQFEAGSNYHCGEFVAEDVIAEFFSAMATPIHDCCFAKHHDLNSYQQQVFTIAKKQSTISRSSLRNEQ